MTVTSKIKVKKNIYHKTYLDYTKTLQHRLLLQLIKQLWDCNCHYDQLQKACTLSEDTKGY